MLLSDRDILVEIDAGRVALEPYDPGMLQPSSIDVRLDRYFRVFENHKYPHIDPAADQVVFGSRTLVTDGGLRRAEVHSDTALFYDDNTRMDMRIVNVVFYNSSGGKEAVLTSRTGRYLTRDFILEARGDVVITTVDGRKLTSQQVKYDQRVNQVSSDSAFVLTEGGREASGIGFVSDPDMNNIRIFKASRVKAGQVEVPKP